MVFHTDIALINQALVDLRAIVHRGRAETLDRDDFEQLTARIRANLKLVRADLQGEADALEADGIELLDAGSAVARARALGTKPAVQDLIRRIPGVLTARALQDAGGVNRARLYGHLACVDGGRTEGAAP